MDLGGLTAFQNGLLAKFFFPSIFCLSLLLSEASGYPYATFVMDGRTGETLHSNNAEKIMHPASLTKMMTLYIAFNHVETKKISLDQKVTISKNAANEPPSKFGYRVGQRVSFRYLIRAAAIRSANDAATALGEAISGSEEEFANYMTRVARAMGMAKTTFKNANGLTQTGHMSTAKDMAILSRRLIFDFPEYYHLFGRTSVLALGKTLYNTNRKFLRSYNGADGIKTGFTSAAGYNLAASSNRSNKRIIAVVFGSGSVALRTKRMSELLDIGFSKAREEVKFVPLKKLILLNNFASYSSNSGRIESLFIPVLRPLDIFSTSDKNSSISEDLVRLVLEQPDDFLGTLEKDYDFPLMRPGVLERVGSTTLKKNNNLETTVKKQSSSDRSERLEPNFQIQIGAFGTAANAKRELSKFALRDLETLSTVSSKISTAVVNKKKVFRVSFIGLSESDAYKSCERLVALNEICDVIEPN